MSRSSLRCRAAAAIGLGALAAAAACGGSPDELYQRGLDSFRQQRLDDARKNLTAFTEKSCGPAEADPRCGKAYLTLGRIEEKRAAPARAWAAYDAARGFSPHGDDAELAADLDRTQQALAQSQGSATGRGPVIIRYRDEVTDEYNPRSLVISLDFAPVLTKDKDASELHSADFRKVYGGSVAAGEHVLVIDMVHDCKPSGGVRCVRSHVRKSWTFENEARTPATIEIRAYAESGEGDNPSRPALDFNVR